MTARLRTIASIALLMALAAAPRAAAPIRVMLLDGESGGPWHKWQLTTPVLKKVLDETGLFAVDVVTAPAAQGELSAFAPDWKAYRAVVWNYDAPDARWPAALKKSFEDYVGAGGGRRHRARRRQRVPRLDRVQRDDRHRRLAQPHREGRALLVPARTARSRPTRRRVPPAPTARGCRSC